MDSLVTKDLMASLITNELMATLKREGAIIEKKAKSFGLKLAIVDVTGYRAVVDHLFTEANCAIAPTVSDVAISIFPDKGVLCSDYHSLLSHFPNLRSVRFSKG